MHEKQEACTRKNKGTGKRPDTKKVMPQKGRELQKGNAQGREREH